MKNKKGKIEISWAYPSEYELKTKDIFREEEKFMYFIPEGFTKCKIPVGMGKINLINVKTENETIYNE